LVIHHSLTGVEAEINRFLMQRFTALGVEVWSDSPQETLRDRADNIIAKIPGKNPERAIAILYRFTTKVLHNRI
jgi:putative aminopeptidase FrvX